MSDERILIADDELSVVQVCTRALMADGYRVHGANGGQEALDCLEKAQFDLLLVDLLMPDLDGLEVVRRAKELDPAITAVIITAHGTLKNAIDALRAGARGFLLKPFELDELLLTVREALGERRREQENLQARALLPILEISQSLMVAGDVASLVGRLLEIVVRQVGANRASLMLTDEDSNTLHIAGTVGLPAGEMGEIHASEPGRVIEKVLQREEPLLVGREASLDPSLQGLIAGWDGVVISVPLRTGQKVAGVLNLGCPGDRPRFTQSELEFLSVMGGQIATVLDNARLYEALRASEARYRAVTELTSDYAYSFRVGSDGMIVPEWSEGTTDAFSRMTGFTLQKMAGTDWPSLVHPDDSSIAVRHGQILLSGQPDASEFRIVTKSGQVRWFRDYARPVWDETQGRVVGIVGAAQDVTERKQAEEALQKRNRELVLFNHAVQLFSSTLNMDQLLVTVLEEMRRQLDVTACSVWLADPETQELICRQASGPHGEQVRGWRLAPGEGLAGCVAQSGESLIVPDVQTNERHFKGVDRMTGLPLRSILSVPLQVKRAVIGVLQLVDTEVARFGPADVMMAESIAAAAAIAIENARLYEEADQLRAFNENIVQSMEEVILLEDPTGHITFANRRVEDLLGYTPGELVGRHWTAIVPAEEVARVKEETGKRPEGIAGRYETILVTREGQFVPVIVSTRPLFDDGHFAGVLSVFTDITELKRAEEGLRESEERYRSLFDNAPLCIFEVDLTQMPPTITRVNDRAGSVYGWPPKQLAAMPLETLFPSETRADTERVLRALKADKTISLESVNRRRDGSVFPVHLAATPGSSLDLKRAIIAVEDITAEKSRRTEEEAIAEERRRIAREIHDGLAQDLASLRLRVSLWHGLVDQDPAEMHAELDALRELLRQKIQDVRRSIFALRPVALDELGFYPALRQFVGDFGGQNQLHVELHILGPEDSLPHSLEPVLFRIIQEALNNIGKHAYASTAWIELNLRAADSVTLTVRDNGVGFEPATLDQAVQRGHLGLRQMRERVEGLGGTFSLASEAGKGTEINVVLPLSRP